MSDVSIPQYDLLMPRRIVFGWGRRSELPDLVKTTGKRAFLIVGSRTLQENGTIGELADSLASAGLDVIDLATISREPEVSDVDRATRLLLETGVREGDFLIAIGGGAAVDLAKAVAAMATNRDGDGVRDYLEGVGRGLQVTRPPLPMIAVPTTAGTGSEATKNAVISSYDPAFKKSLRSELMVPDVVVVDPELTVSAPRAVTANSGMDALTQLIESFISRRAKPIPQALCRHGMRLSFRYLVEAVEQPGSRPAREAMSHAALLSGIALANSGLGMAHGVAAALGVHCGVPHGLACAVMLPTALRVNFEVSRDWISEIAEIAGTTDVINHVVEVGERIGIPQSLSAIGVNREQIPDIVRSSRGNSMNGNPREISDAELTQILEDLL